MQQLIVKQRVDYTYKFNQNVGRHGWLRLTPAYSIKVVEEILKESPVHTCVLDPFSGTATTSLCAAYRNLESISLEINPFLVWLGKVKVGVYNAETLSHTREAAKYTSP